MQRITQLLSRQIPAVLYGMQWFLLICSVLILARMLKGPSSADRLAALNIFSGIVLAFLVITGVQKSGILYLDVALVYDIFGFLGFLAISHFLKNKFFSGDKTE